MARRANYKCKGSAASMQAPLGGVRTIRNCLCFSLSLSFSPIYLLVLSTFSSSSLAVVVRKQVKRIKANAASVSTVCCL